MQIEHKLVFKCCLILKSSLLRIARRAHRPEFKSLHFRLVRVVVLCELPFVRLYDESRDSSYPLPRYISSFSSFYFMHYFPFCCSFLQQQMFTMLNIVCCCCYIFHFHIFIVSFFASTAMSRLCIVSCHVWIREILTTIKSAIRCMLLSVLPQNHSGVSTKNDKRRGKNSPL